MVQYDGLSNREADVVNLLLEGKSNKQIASALHITESTVEFHLKNIYAKFKVSSRTELILKLGKSTVAPRDEIPDNQRGSNVSNGFASLREAVSKIGREFQVENSMNASARGGGQPVTFFESIRICLLKFADFSGRASRSEFWWFFLFLSLIIAALTYLSEAAAAAFTVIALLPLLAAGTRRLRDSGKSGWWQLFLLAPVGGLVVVGILWALPPVSPLPGEETAA